MDWTSGYRADIDYTCGYHGDPAPRMRYLEFGNGQGVTVNIAAAPRLTD